ncbi:MAG: hypothetical protein AB7G93_00240 [Bdellovibrionales bacterium]
MSKAKDKKGVKRIVNLTVNEFSPVDKPAIGEEFIIIKSLDGRKPSESFGQVIEKGISWKSSVEKGHSEEGICHFCKVDGGSEPKIGLKCGVCFSCAFDRMDKGVFDQCLAGSFSFEEYKKAYPQEFDTSEKALVPSDSMSKDELKKSLEGRSDKFDIEMRDDAALTFPAGFPAGLDDYADPVNLKFPIDTVERTKNSKVRFKQLASSYKEEESKAVIHERIVRRELKLGMTPGFDPEDPLDQLLPSDLKEELEKGSAHEGGDMKEELEKIRKQFSELKTMLEQSLSLHDEAARALNQIVELNLMALEQVAMLTGDGNGEGQANPTPEQTEMMQSISTFKAEISKVGAKISTERLTVLREISEKLSTLIRSVMGGKKEGKKDLSKAAEGLVSRVQSLETSVEAIRNESTNKIEAIGKRLNEIENTAGGSAALSDDEEGGDNGDGKDKSQKSVFSDIIGLDDIKMQISRREAFLNKPKTNS